MEKTLVVGATGQLGTAVVRRLVAAGTPVRALVRSEAGARFFSSLGVQVAQGDLTQPDTLVSACSGIGVVVATANAAIPSRSTDTFAAVDRQGYLNLIDAAVQARVRRFVYTSVGEPKRQPAFFQYKRETEARLMSSGLDSVIFRADIFMDTGFCMLGSDLPVRGAESATVVRPYRFAADHFGRIRHSMEKHRTALVPGSGDCRHAFICVDDVAAFLAAAVSRGPSGIHVAAGPQAISFLDVVRIYEEILGYPLRVRRTPAWIFRTAATVMTPFSPAASNLMWLNYIAATEETLTDGSAAAANFGVQLSSAETFLRTKAEATASTLQGAA